MNFQELQQTKNNELIAIKVELKDKESKSESN
jgi:hypothetical protein